MEQLTSVFVSDERTHRDDQSHILGISAVLILGSSRFAWLGFEDAFVSVCQQGIFIFGGFENDGSSFSAVTAGWTSEWDPHFSPAGHDTIPSRT
jgi:hypothetical protein